MNSFITYKYSNPKRKRRVGALFAKVFVLLTGFLLPSCVAEDLPECEAGSLGPDGADAGNYLLSFNIILPSMQQSTRASEYAGSTIDESWEDYVDPQNMFILFLNEEGYLVKKIFTGSTPTRELSMVPVEDFDNSTIKSWYVRLSITNMGNEGKKLANFLRNHPFKLAVLANTSLTSADQLNLTESVLTNEGEIVEESKGDHINTLHHQTDYINSQLNYLDPQILYPEPYKYSLKSETDEYEDDTDKNKIYQFLYSGNPNNTHNKILGFYSDWVKNNNNQVTTELKARDYIRENWDPSTGKGPDKYKKYGNLWYLWNFGGNEGTGKSENAVPILYKADEWSEKVGNFLRGKVNGNDGKTIDDFDTSSKQSDNTLSVVNFTEGSDRITAVCREEGGKTYYGLKIPYVERNAGTPDGGSYKKLGSSDKGYISFEAHATGNLIIRGKGINGTVRVVAQAGISTTKQNFSIAKDKIDTQTKRISITGDSQTVYIYVDGAYESNKNKAVEIYEIEFVEDKYLYDTDRTGVQPEDQPIPMYGVQHYPALEAFWEEGTHFDLSNFNNLTTHPGFAEAQSDIPLLRSVAKIVLNIPTSLNADHVFLRSLNRSARWEPMNVESDTYSTWKDHIVQDATDGHSRQCEWFSIRYHQPFYEGTDGSESTDIYKNKLAWYYADWATNSLDGNITRKTGWEDFPVPNEGLNYCGGETGTDLRGWNHDDYGFPKVMNPMINRSDFCEFIKGGTNGTYDHYVLYVGEKFVDDPNSVKEPLTSNPKVCHIEFRTKDDPDSNLDDNNCYRIYFIEEGVNKDALDNGYPDFTKDENADYYNDWENLYEKKPDNLQKHWPIMRNHCYTFTVTDVTNKMVIVKLEVLPWKVIDNIPITW